MKHKNDKRNVSSDQTNKVSTNDASSSEMVQHEPAVCLVDDSKSSSNRVMTVYEKSKTSDSLNNWGVSMNSNKRTSEQPSNNWSSSSGWPNECQMIN